MSTHAQKKAAPRADYRRPHVRSNVNLLKPRPEKPEVVTEAPRKRLRDEFGDLFKFEHGTVGSDILVLRGYMRHIGAPEIPETATVKVFATLFSRFVLPRREWPHFTNEGDARNFLRRWAKDSLPLLMEGEPMDQPKPHRSMIPEMLAYYDPRYLGLGVR